MKISITYESKKILTLEEAAKAQKIIEGEKEDSYSAADAAAEAVNAAAVLHNNDRCTEVFKAKAEIAKNCRVRDYYFEGSGDLDVWIEATAATYDGFCIIGAYLSDIYSITSENKSEIASHMFIRWFKEVA